jgi:molybdopterin converting factor small subunit
MKVRLLHFASFRDAAGREEELREFHDGGRVEELWAELSREVPYFARFTAMPPAAVNREYVPAGTVLRDGDEIAFLPPVAGG